MAKIATPAMVPQTLPRPPASTVSPITATAMLSRSYIPFRPTQGVPDPSREARQRRATAAQREKDVGRNDHLIGLDAGEPRGLDVAADRDDVRAQPRGVEQNRCA